MNGSIGPRVNGYCATLINTPTVVPEGYTIPHLNDSLLHSEYEQVIPLPHQQPFSNGNPTGCLT